jgi:hypothetical protein
MPAAIFTLEFEQGIPRDVTVSEWRDEKGALYSLADCTSRLQVRARIGDADALIDLSTTDSTIEIINDQIVAHFSAEHTRALQQIEGSHALPGSPASAPAYKAGVFEWRVWNKDGIPFALARGDVVITLSVVTAETA